MASAKILESKKAVVEEIENKIKNSESVILFTYQGLTVSELSGLRRELKKVFCQCYFLCKGQGRKGV